MNKIFLVVLVLVFCAGVFFVPQTSHAGTFNSNKSSFSFASTNIISPHMVNIKNNFHTTFSRNMFQAIDDSLDFFVSGQLQEMLEIAYGAIINRGKHLQDFIPFESSEIMNSIYGVYTMPFADMVDAGVDFVVPFAHVRPIALSVGTLKKGCSYIPKNYPCDKVGELVSAFRLTKLAPADIAGITGAVLSGGNVQRVNLIIDWVQGILNDTDAMLGKPFGLKGIFQVRYVNMGIDWVQNGVEKSVSFVNRFTLKGIDKTIGGTKKLLRID